jgi:hypothetical protein
MGDLTDGPPSGTDEMIVTAPSTKNGRRRPGSSPLADAGRWRVPRRLRVDPGSVIADPSDPAKRTVNNLHQSSQPGVCGAVGGVLVVLQS